MFHFTYMLKHHSLPSKSDKQKKQISAYIYTAVLMHPVGLVARAHAAYVWRL